jgi:hypothetical protein
MQLTRPLSTLVLLGWAAGAAAAAEKPAAEKPAAAAPAAAPTADAKPAGPPQPWKDMTGEQKAKYMKEVVVPKMRVTFQQFDPEEFKKVGCDTCHGKDAKARKFKMPNPDLPVLPSSPAGFAPLMEKKPKMMKFMSGMVKPQMAALLGLPEFDPKKPEAGGFGCAACHTFKKE